MHKRTAAPKHLALRARTGGKFPKDLDGGRLQWPFSAPLSTPPHPPAPQESYKK